MSSVSFEFYTAGRIIFGAEAIKKLPAAVSEFGSKVLLVVGGKFADKSGLTKRLCEILPIGAVVHCSKEPHIEDVDQSVLVAKKANCDVVLAVGGGSVLDCGKATAFMMTNAGSLCDYLEGVGAGKKITNPPLAMIAVPTTAGTGSEVTKNAVISGPGYKKSVRSSLLIPKVALVDPLLTHSMSPSVTAACGMDALTQLIEAYLSIGANPFTDALALQGIQAASKGLCRAYENGNDSEARENMALASLLSGICLANAGLGAVHGFASCLGAMFSIGHGMACAAMLFPVLKANIEVSRQTPYEERIHSRFAKVAQALTGKHFGDRETTVQAGLEEVESIAKKLNIPTLSQLGVQSAHFSDIASGARGSSMKYNPIDLSDAQLEAILKAAM